MKRHTQSSRLLIMLFYVVFYRVFCLFHQSTTSLTQEELKQLLSVYPFDVPFYVAAAK